MHNQSSVLSIIYGALRKDTNKAIDSVVLDNDRILLKVSESGLDEDDINVFVLKREDLKELP